MNSFENLIEQIDAFIRKYYKNQMLKGLLLFVGLSLFTFLFVITLEFFGRFSSSVRTFFFFSFLLFNSFILVKYIILPLSKFFSFGSRIDRFQAADIIGKFFPTISDRLINTLQLNDSLINNDVNYELIRASINQRAEKLSAVTFVHGIDFKKNLSYLKYVGPIIFIFICVALFYPALVSQGTKRVVNYSEEFIPKAPFDFLILNNNMEIIEGEDFPIELKVKGDNLPEKVYLVSSSGKFLMNKTSKISSFFVLKRVKESIAFSFEANGFTSDIFKLTVIPKSIVGKMQATLKYPSYLGKKNQVVSNAGDLSVPEGTKISWSIATKNTSKVKLFWRDTSFASTQLGFVFEKNFYKSTPMSLVLYNSKNKIRDSLRYNIDVVPDQFPAIDVVETVDSISDAVRYFEGQISDDYGLSSLYFVYNIVSKDGNRNQQKVSVLNPSGNSIPFRHAIDFRREKLTVDDKIEYYFIVKDNDGVHGSKSTRSKTFVYELPSLEELNEKRDEAQSNSKDQLKDLIKKASEFKKDISKLKKEVTNSKSTDWNQLNQVQQLKEERNAIENELQQLELKMQESLVEKNQLSEMDKELLDKQELLQELLDEVMDDELKELLNKLEEMMKKQEKNNLENNLEKIDEKSEDINKQLDRSLEMLKKMQVNEKIDDLVKELKDLSKEQEDLKDDISKDKIDSEEAEKKQEDINKKFEEIKDDLNKLKELNEELKKPLNLGDQEEMKQQISDALKEAKENLSDKKEKKAAQSQENSSKKMEQMAKEMEQMQDQANKQQEEEDIDLLRNILESLMTLSFNQEDIMKSFSKVKDKDPFYSKLGRKQRSIIDDTKIVEDSLNALAVRQPKIASFIDKELNDINNNFAQGLENVDEHRRRELGTNLQFVMTGYNNLALMLNESLQDMQKKMQSEMPGSGSCDKPGGKGSKPSDGESGDMKEMLKKQLEQMQKGPKGGGQKPGGNKPGTQDGQNMLGLGNKEIAKMAAQQTAIRQRLEELRNELNKEGKGKGNQLNPLINDLEKQEKDLINKQFSNDVIKRQKDIISRLLESEKALMERGFEDKRESKVGKNVFLSNQKRIDEYNNQKLKQIELLRSVDPVFRKYYKDKANDYFNFVN